MKNEDKLIKKLLKVAKEISSRLGYVEIDHHKTDFYLSNGESADHSVLVRRRFSNIRIDIRLPDAGFLSFEFNKNDMKYSESQVKWDGILHFASIKNLLNNELGLESNCPEFDQYKKRASQEFSIKEKAYILSREPRIKEEYIAAEIFNRLKDKYNLEDAGVSNMYTSNKLNEEINVLSIENNIVYLKSYLNNSLVGLVRLNLSKGFFFNSSQIFYEKGIILANDLILAINMSLIGILKERASSNSKI